MDIPIIDECSYRLKKAGWSIGDVGFMMASGTCWLVTCQNGEHVVQTEGETQATAWQLAAENAEALGMFYQGPIEGLP